jgi:Uncharacterized conserved protein (DUF2039)
MSTARGSGVGRTRAQAYQNTHAFRHNKNSKKSNLLRARVNTGGLCLRCSEKIEWRIKYRKYKPLTQPRKCNGCDERSVRHAYRTLCDDCADKRGVCPQCAEATRVNPKVPSKTEANREQDILEGAVESMRERHRRTIYRKAARGEDVSAALAGANKSDDDYSHDEGEDDSDQSEEAAKDDESSGSDGSENEVEAKNKLHPAVPVESEEESAAGAILKTIYSRLADANVSGPDGPCR